jgi:ubiquinone/menaquinone biosynthesis C-methylase UbiE
VTWLAALASIPVPEGQRDIWAEWLAVRRFGGDPEQRRRMLDDLAPVRDKVLDRSGLAAGETLLDVGCGEGMIAFGALERGAGHVIFSDISQDVLDFCRQLADERCSFVRAPAEDLTAIPDGSVDVVTTRSVLIYTAEKERAFREFFRVLRPGGRISLYEPINRFGMEEKRRDLWGYPSDGVGELVQRILRVYEEIQPASDPMLDFDERDLVALAEAADFFPIELELRAEVKAPEPRPWNAFVNHSGNPKVPTIAEAMDQALAPEERERLAEHLRPLVEQGAGVWRMAHAYLAATKP